MKQSPSPNFNERNAPQGLRYVVLHYTGMKDAQSALDRMCDPTTKVSAHYMIDGSGETFQLVEENQRAWHAGVCRWKDETDLNSLSIGIELVNPGHEFGYRPFPSAQIQALKILLADITRRHTFAADYLLGHSDIAPTRRQDPGELFPWKDLAAAGFGYWPESSPQTPQPPCTPDTIHKLLRQVGYDCPDDDEAAAQAAETAFLRRYHPEQLSGGFTAESYARLVDLAEHMAKNQ